MRLTTALKLMNHPTVEALKKSMRATVDEAPQLISKVRDEKKKIMYDKLDKLNKWYVKIIGLDEVKLYQERVTSLQEQLLTMQEKRREVSRQLADIRRQSLDLQDQIHKVKRQEDLQKFLDLMKEETEVLKLENSVSRTFQDYDQMERELFTAFSNAIRDSHEKQRAQMEYTKYFGLILSMAGSFLAFVYTSVKKQDLKRFIEDKLSTMASSNGNPIVASLVEANENTMKEVIKNRQVLAEVVRTLSSNAMPESGVRQALQALPKQWENSVEMHVDLRKAAIIGAVTFCTIVLFSIIISNS